MLRSATTRLQLNPGKWKPNPVADDIGVYEFSLEYTFLWYVNQNKQNKTKQNTGINIIILETNTTMREKVDGATMGIRTYI